MNNLGIDQLLSQLQSASSLAAGKDAAPAPGAADFAAMLKSSIEQVNQSQQQAASLAKEFELGSPNANLQEVMVSLQKANISFQTMVQVRNRLVTAYQEIMSMQV